MNKKLISIIIPVYNGEIYLSDCLDSILNQTYKNIEIIIINDGSTDSTQSIINLYNKKYDFIYNYYQEKAGQGIARNKGLKYAKGDFIAFIDADDIINEKFLEKLYDSINEYNSDLAICDWMYYYDNNNTKYINKNKFMGYSLLENKTTELVLTADIYFTVNKLYRKEFLTKNNIKYGEGYIYEDYEFYIKTCVLANRISTVHNPYYYVRVNQYSTTKSNYNSMLHYDSFLKAIKVSLDGISFKNKYSKYYIYKYFLNRSHTYYSNRMPSKQVGKRFLKNVFLILNKNNYDLQLPLDTRKKDKIIFKYILPKSKINYFILINSLTKNKKIKKIIKKYSFKNILKFNNFIKSIYYKIQLKNNFYANTVLFLGFDNRYIGNSKYFYDYLLEKQNVYKNIYFVTNLSIINYENRVIPNSFKFWKLLARSKNIIFETWVPANYKKRIGANWIQMWHGTPIKKMLFDSNELHISSIYENHKLIKYKDILRWNYLICENISNKSYFTESFLIDSKKVLAYGYPRVQYLADSIGNQSKTNQIKKYLNIPLNKKIIFYAPTWRDYNYKEKKEDHNYLLDLNELKNKISNEYIILFKNHSFLNTLNISNIINIDEDVETQDLLLISDILISDYSSIIFDFVAIDKPIILYTNDIIKYQVSRGLYSSVWKDLHFSVTKNINGVLEKIDAINSGKYPMNELLKIKNNYCCNNIKHSYENIEKLLK
ncbi:MAG: CDP-glycerol glycerophosphotransferase family protein [Bacilli bacterium]|nr:CDP-glycerol glycerophosphotransferase family protein [Bacilli bacterium]MDD4406972.1 CDP-glycerol glycerophosphotransferase family protein [Bacilli bacterium]